MTSSLSSVVENLVTLFSAFTQVNVADVSDGNGSRMFSVISLRNGNRIPKPVREMQEWKRPTP
jgi:hypothetical protein